MDGLSHLVSNMSGETEKTEETAKQTKIRLDIPKYKSLKDLQKGYGFSTFNGLVNQALDVVLAKPELLKQFYTSQQDERVLIDKLLNNLEIQETHQAGQRENFVARFEEIERKLNVLIDLKLNGMDSKTKKKALAKLDKAKAMEGAVFG